MIIRGGENIYPREIEQLKTTSWTQEVRSRESAIWTRER
jgi:hypothetical protein